MYMYVYVCVVCINIYIHAKPQSHYRLNCFVQPFIFHPIAATESIEFVQEAGSEYLFFLWDTLRPRYRLLGRFSAS